MSRNGWKMLKKWKLLTVLAGESQGFWRMGSSWLGGLVVFFRNEDYDYWIEIHFIIAIEYESGNRC